MTELLIQRLLMEVLAVIDRLKIPYMIVGGFAVRTWEIPSPGLTPAAGAAPPVPPRRPDDNSHGSAAGFFVISAEDAGS